MIDPVSSIQGQPIGPAQVSAAELRGTAETGRSEAGFDKVLGKLIEEVDEAQKSADGSIRALAAGDSQGLHDVVLKMEEAELTFRLMKEIRDKLVQAYKEIVSVQ